ncbi:MAG: preprotein translocase subunit SecG [Chromatiales bacterium]|nr:preprotein translocase subunit SecG [Chromatiales bacterium]
METIILIVHVLAAVGVVALVLIQQGKGADMGAAFGSGASSTVFGSQGSSSFITRATAILATTFFITSMGLAMISSQGVEDTSVVEAVTSQEVDSGAPVAEDMPSAPEAPAMESAASDMPAAPAADMPEAPQAPVAEGETK